MSARSTVPGNPEYDLRLLQIRLNAVGAERDELLQRIASHREYIAKLTAENQRLRAALNQRDTLRA